MATTSISLSLSPFLSKFKPKPHYSLNTHISPLSLSTYLSPKRNIHFHHPIHRLPKKSNKIWSISATTTEEVLPSDTTPLENSQEIVTSTGDDGVSTIISALLFIAFITLAILTIGVIYIVVTDFLQKREGEKFKKEEAAKKKKSKTKGKVRARTGPKGFGQKIDEFDDDDIDD